MPPLAALWLDWAVTALWPIVGKSGTVLFSSVLFTEAGLAIGFLCLLPWLLRRGRWRAIVSRDLRARLFLVGFFGSGLSNLLLIGAMNYTTPANAAVMAQIEVLYSAVLCALLLKEAVTFSQGLGSGLILLGTWLIISRDMATIRWKGDLMVLAAPWALQASHILVKGIPRKLRLDAITLAAARMFYGAVSLIPAAAWTLAHGPRWSWTPAGAGLLLAQGGGMFALNHVLWYQAIHGMDLAKATAIIYAYPALTVLLSWGLGMEQVHPVQIAGLALTIAGAVWVSSLAWKKGGAHDEAFTRIPEIG